MSIFHGEAAASLAVALRVRCSLQPAGECNAFLPVFDTTAQAPLTHPQTRQTPDPVPLHGSADKEISSKNGKDIDLPPRTSTSLPTTPTSKAPSPSAAPNTAAHAPTLALLNGEGQTHRHSSSLPANSITVNPPPAPTQVTTFAPSPTPALSKTPSPESQPPSARSSTIVVHSPPPSIPSHLSVAAEDVSRRSSFRHMFRRTSKDHNKKRDTPSKSKHCHGKGDVHSSRDAFSDGDDCAHMSPASLDSSIDYESAFKAVMLENIKLREEMAELRRRSSLPLAVDGHHEHYHHHLESREGQDTKGLALGLGQGTRPTPDLEQSVRELTTAIRAVPGRILIIVLIAGFVAIFKSWKFETCVYVV